MGGGFFAGVLIGYALKKVIKIVAVIVGPFLAGLAYLQYHHIANIIRTAGLLFDLLRDQL